MMKNIRLTALICTLLLSVSASAEGLFDDVELKARVGYSIGGTAPLSMPATIRSIEAFHLTPNFLVGVDASSTPGSNWGWQVGLFIENKGMDGEVKTKAYRMKVRMDESEMEGYYTGRVRQKVTEWMFTLPVQATFLLSEHVKLKAGPYVSLLFNKDFSGYASDGYLRKDDPTGPKVVMGSKEGEWATYDFSDDMPAAGWHRCRTGMADAAAAGALFRPLVGTDRYPQERLQDRRADALPHLRNNCTDIQTKIR